MKMGVEDGLESGPPIVDDEIGAVGIQIRTSKCA